MLSACPQPSAAARRAPRPRRLTGMPTHPARARLAGSCQGMPAQPTQVHVLRAGMVRWARARAGAQIVRPAASSMVLRRMLPVPPVGSALGAGCSKSPWSGPWDAHTRPQQTPNNGKHASLAFALSLRWSILDHGAKVLTRRSHAGPAYPGYDGQHDRLHQYRLLQATSAQGL